MFNKMLALIREATLKNARAVVTGINYPLTTARTFYDLNLTNSTLQA